MSGRQYTLAEKARYAAQAEVLRDQGMSIPAAAKVLEVNPKTLYRWVKTRTKMQREPRVDYDEEAGCWRIYVFHRTAEMDPQKGVYWWPLEWLSFASEDVAREHLEMHGEYRAVA